MTLPSTVVALLRVLLVLLFALLLLGQVFAIPGQFAGLSQDSPDVSFMRWPLTVVGILEFACIQVVVVCTWKLLAMVKADRIFSKDAFVWVDGIVWAITAGWALFAAMSLTVAIVSYVTPELRDPGTPMLLFGMTLMGTVLVLLMVVLRALLRQAAALRTDMDAVI